MKRGHPGIFSVFMFLLKKIIGCCIAAVVLTRSLLRMRPHVSMRLPV